MANCIKCGEDFETDSDIPVCNKCYKEIMENKDEEINE